jgi:hypothetical protein
MLITVVGYNTYEDRKAANCYDGAIKFLEEDPELIISWVTAEKKSKEEKNRIPFIDFSSVVAHKLIYGLHHGCWGVVNNPEGIFESDPISVAAKFKVRSEELKKKPVKVYGVEIPDVATVGLGGTKVQIAMATFVQALQFVLAPVMLLWLGSLYHTRIRELLTYRRTDDILRVHPHVINVFPVGHYPDLRKKNWIRSKAPVMWSVATALIRIALISVFTVPAAGGFITSLFYQPIFGMWFLNLVTGFLVFSYTCGVLIVETVVGVKHFNGENPLR